jgi:hypothetical protein
LLLQALGEAALAAGHAGFAGAEGGDEGGHGGGTDTISLWLKLREDAKSDR